MSIAGEGDDFGEAKRIMMESVDRAYRINYTNQFDWWRTLDHRPVGTNDGIKQLSDRK